MEILIKDNEYIKFFIKTESDKYSSLTFKVYEVTAWDMDNKPCEEDNELFIKGTIKWDGCSHIYFGDEDGYMHLCGNDCFENLKKVLDAVWTKAEKEIKGFNKDVAY